MTDRSIILNKLVNFLEKKQKRSCERIHIMLYYPYETVQGVIHKYALSSKYCNGKVLEIGCGEGYGIYYISRNADPELIVGGDCSFQTLRKAKIYLYNRDINIKNKIKKFICLDAHNLPFKENVFDTVVALELIEHLNDPNKFLAEVYRVLRANGTFILSTPNGGVKRPIEQYHTRLFTVEELSDLLEDSGFKIKDIFAFPRSDEERSYIFSLIRYIVDSLADMFLNDYLYNLFRKIMYQVLGVKYILFEGMDKMKADPEFTPLSLDRIKVLGMIPWDIIVITKKEV